MKDTLSDMWRKPMLLTTLFVVNIVFAFGQDNVLKNVLPPSPNVASLGKYGEVPVSLYTGIPNISIPIYEIIQGNLSLPISLSYHAGGIRVEEIASAVGLGWSLNAGGMISRSTRGIPDEISQWNNQPLANRIETIMQSGNTILHQNLAIDVRSGEVDGEPDLYTYNFNGQSGKFFYDQEGSVHTVPKQNISIATFGSGWKVIGEDGTVYIFTETEQISSSACTGDQTALSAWFLASITSSDGKREIKFSYDAVNYVYSSIIGETQYISINGGACLQSSPPCIQSQSYSTHRIRKIDFQEGYVEFIYNDVRCDLVDDKSLDEVKIFTKNAQLLRKFVLSQSYFGNTSSPCDRFNEHTKRLKLDSVTEQNSTLVKPPFEFQYNESAELPSRFSYAQDHWGYYNGKTNQGLVPAMSILGPNGLMYISGADRRVDPSLAMTGILTQIKYPTQGKTIFTYESNTVSGPGGIYDMQTQTEYLHLEASNDLVSGLPTPYESASLSVQSQGAFIEYSNISGLDNPLWQGCDIVKCLVIKDNNEVTPFKELQTGSSGGTDFWPAGSYKLKLVTECGVDAIANFVVSITAKVIISNAAENRLVGGLRIVQIEDHPGNGGTSISRRYRYHLFEDDTKSSGVLTNLPIYQNDLSVEKIGRNEQGEPTGPPIFCQYRVVSSFSNYPLATTNGGHVGYSNVILDQEENGEAWYTYTVPASITPAFPFAPIENFDWRGGFLLSTKNLAREGSQLRMVNEVASTPLAMQEYRIYGIKTGTNYQIIDASVSVQPPPEFAFYPIITEFYTIGQSIETTFSQSDPTQFFRVQSDFTYSPTHLQLIQTNQTTRATGTLGRKELVTFRKYPLDFTFTGSPVGTEALGIKKLQDLHIVNQVIEEYKVRQDVNEYGVPSNQRFVGGTIQTFKASVPYPDQLYKAETSEPVSSFAASSIGGNAFIKAAYYKPIAAFLTYDDNGNLTSQRKEKDFGYCYIWGYSNTLPIAEVANATMQETSEVASTMRAFSSPSAVNAVSLITPLEIDHEQDIVIELDMAGVNPPYQGSQTIEVILSIQNITNGTPVNYVFTFDSFASHKEQTIHLPAGRYSLTYAGKAHENDPDYNFFGELNYGIMVRSASVFHTSFEEDMTNTATVAKTGRLSHLGLFPVVIPKVIGNYVLSYWKKLESEPWIYFEESMSVDNTEGGSVIIGSQDALLDEVRLFPSGARMTTYTHDPLIGVTSITDPNNIVNYYEYDEVGRLKVISDDKGNIVKRYKYHYAQASESEQGGQQ